MDSSTLQVDSKAKNPHRKMKRIYGLIFLLLTVVIILIILISRRGSIPLFEIAEDELPDFKFSLINGDFIQSSDFKTDKYILLLFFNSECDYCIHEIEALTDSISWLNQCRILLISHEDSMKIASFYRQYRLADYPDIQVAYTTEEEVNKLFKVYINPTLYVYHPDRRMIKYKPGPVTVSDIIKYIKIN